MTARDSSFSRLGLPTFVQGYLKDIGVRPACDGDYAFDPGVDTLLVRDVRWDFGDLSSGALNTHRGKLSRHKYARERLYDVKVRYELEGVLDSTVKRVQVYLQPSVNLGADRSLPLGGSVLLDGSALSSGADLKYSWEELLPGGGATPLSNTARHTFTREGEYALEVENPLGCVARDTVKLGGLRVDLGKDTVLCSGATHTLDAGRYLTAAQLASTPGPVYRWSDGSVGRRLVVVQPAVLPPGGVIRYSVDVTVDGSTQSDAIDVTYVPELKVDLGLDQLLCYGSSSVLDATPGIFAGRALTYRWEKDGVLLPGVVVANPTVSSAGRYKVRVTDRVCSVLDSVLVGYKSEVKVDLGRDTLLCYGATHTLDAGRMLTTAQLSSVPAPTYRWIDGSGLVLGVGRRLLINSNKSETYTVEVTVDGCTVSDGIAVDYVPELKVDLGLDQLLCYGSSSVLDATPGIFAGRALTYRWEKDGVLLPGLVVANPTVSSAGRYKVRVTDRVCSVLDSVLVGYKSEVKVDLGSDTLLCFGATHTLDAGRMLTVAQLSSVPAPAYRWIDGSGLVLGVGRRLLINSNKSETYTVEVTVDGCTVSDVIAVDYVPELKIDLGLDRVLCYGSTATLDATPAIFAGRTLTYRWERGIARGALLPGVVVARPTISSAGRYKVRVTDRVCSVLDSVLVGYKSEVKVDLGRDTLLCYGATHTLDAGRMLTASQLSSVPAPAYRWIDGSGLVLGVGRRLLINSNKSETYTVEVTVDGCTVSDVIAVDYVPELKIDLGLDRVLCYGSTETLDATPVIFAGRALTYRWERDGALLPGVVVANPTVSSAGRYKVRVTDRVCSVLDSVLVGYKSEVKVDLGKDTLLCFGATHTLDAGRYLTTSQLSSVPAPAYRWIDGSGLVLGVGRRLLINSNKSETYTVEVTVDGCTVSDAIAVDYVPELKIDLGLDRVLCYGSTETLDATPVIFAGRPLTYSWERNGSLLLGETNKDYKASTSGRYEVKVMDRGCFATDEIDIRIKSELRVDLGKDTLLCTGEEITLDAGRYLTAAQLSLTPIYRWVDGGGSVLGVGRRLLINSDKSGTYTVEVTVDGCTVSDVIAVSYAEDFLLRLSLDTVLCIGDSYTVDLGKDLTPAQRASSSYHYEWSDGDRSRVRTFTAAVDLEARVSLGRCFSDGSIRLGYYDLPSVLLRDTSICLQGSTLLNAGDFDSYLWSTGERVREIEVFREGRYGVDLTYAGGVCHHKAFADVVRNLGPDFELILSGRRLEVRRLGSKNLPYEYSINGEDYGFKSVYEDLLPGVYRLWARDATGCVTPSRSVELGLSIPNYFTPNGDGVNDNWKAEDLEDYDKVHVMIFDRYGRLLYERFDAEGAGWDGTFDGRLQPQTDYWYVIELESSLQGSQTLKGHFTLLRE